MKLVISRLQENVRIRRAITLHSDYSTIHHIQLAMAPTCIVLTPTVSAFKPVSWNFQSIPNLHNMRLRKLLMNSLMIWPLKF